MENRFIRAEEVADELGVSKPYAYKLIRQLNEELKDKPLAAICILHLKNSTAQGGAPLFLGRLEQPYHRIHQLLNAKAVFGATMIDREQGGVLNSPLFFLRKFFLTD